MSKQLQAGFYSDVLLAAIHSGYKDRAIEVTKELLYNPAMLTTDPVMLTTPFEVSQSGQFL